MWTKIFLLFFVFSFLFRTDDSFNQDLGRHIKLGEIITQTHQIPTVNLTSYTNPNSPFINTHWLFEVLTYFFSQAGLLQLLLVLKVLIFIFSVWLIVKLVPKGNSALLLVVGFIFLHVLRERLELRPEIFSFLFTAFTYYILERFLKAPTRLIYLLPAVQLIWINTHIYFFVGLILQAIFIAHILFSGGKLKILSSIFILSVLVSLANPNGLKGLLYPLNVNKNYGYTIVENQTMFLLESINFKDPNFIFVKLSIGIIALSLLIMLLQKRFELRNIVISLAGVILAMLNVRSFPYLVFLSLPATLQNFGEVKNNFITKVIVLFFAGILVFESFSYLNGDYYRLYDSTHQVKLELTQSAKKALDFILTNDLPNPIFNNFDIGSYITYRGYPKYQVFVDGRPEAFPKEFFLNTYIPMQSDFAKFKKEEEKWGFKTIIFSHTDQTPWGKNFLQSIVKDEDFKVVYLDDFMIVLIKSEALKQKNLDAINLSTLSPDYYHFENYVSYIQLGYFLLGTQNTESSRKFIEKALQLNPQSPIAKQLFF